MHTKRSGYRSQRCCEMMFEMIYDTGNRYEASTRGKGGIGFSIRRGRALTSHHSLGPLISSWPMFACAFSRS
jgi:hypothetical protein